MVARPIDEMPDAVRGRIEGVVFDVDDTVTRDGRLERVAFDAMWRMHDAGLRMVALTGRPLGWCDVLARHWPVDLAIGENGAGWVWRDGAEILEGYFEPGARSEHEELLARIRERVGREMPSVRVAADQRARRCDLAFDVGEHARLADPEIETLRGIVEAEGARVAVSTVHLHAMPGEWDKARGTERAIANVLGVELDDVLDRWLFIGDSGNDAPAFERFAVTVGVRNVEPHLAKLPAPPRWITRGDRGVGFAELVDHLLAER